MTFDHIRYHRDEHIGRITLARSEVANVVNLAMADELRRAVVQGRDARVLVIDADGPVFCGGGDLREVGSASDPAQHIGTLAETFHQALLELARSPAVVIAVVGGAVAGGGLGLVLNADLTLAGDRARFLTAYDRVGLTPDSGVTAILPQFVGLARALEMTITGREIDADTALEWGLVTRVVPHEELGTAADELARRIAASPVDHLVETRRLYRRPTYDLAIRLAEEAGLISERAMHHDTRARLARFAPRKGGQE